MSPNTWSGNVPYNIFPLSGFLDSLLRCSWSRCFLPYKSKFCFKKFSTSLVSADLQIFAVGHSLNLSIAFKIWYSPFKFLLFNFPEKSIGISCPDSVYVFSFPNSRFGNWYFKFLPDAMQARQFFTYSSTSFCILGHRKISASATILVDPACPH